MMVRKSEDGLSRRLVSGMARELPSLSGACTNKAAFGRTWPPDIVIRVSSRGDGSEAGPHVCMHDRRVNGVGLQ